MIEEPLCEPVGDQGVVIVTHPGAIVARCYRGISAQLDGLGLGVLEIDKVPEYRQSMLTGNPLNVTLEELSKRFVAATTDFTANRSVTLLGWSFGGVLSYGVAQELSKTTTVAHLILLDSIAPGPGDPGKKFGDSLPDSEALDWFAMYFGAKRGTPLGFLATDFVDDNIDTGLERILERCRRNGTVTGDTTGAGLKKVFSAFVEGILRNKRLHDGFIPAPPRWPVSLIRPERGLFDAATTLGWQDLVGGEVPLHRCSGDHYTMLTDQEHAERLGAIILSVIRSAELTNQTAPQGDSQ